MQLSIAAHSSLALDFIRELKVAALGGLAPSTMLRAGRPGIRRLRAMGFVDSQVPKCEGTGAPVRRAIPRSSNARDLGHLFVARVGFIIEDCYFIAQPQGTDKESDA